MTTTITKKDLLRQRDDLTAQIRDLLAKRGDTALEIAEAGGKDAGKRLAALDEQRHTLAGQRDSIESAIEALDRRERQQAELASIGKHAERAKVTEAAIEALLDARRKALKAAHAYLAAREAFRAAANAAETAKHQALMPTIGADRSMDYTMSGAVQELDSLVARLHSEPNAPSGCEFVERRYRAISRTVNEAAERKAESIRTDHQPATAA
ncbi:hypothetical protein [Pseudoxanthomonas mexicana]